MFCFNQLSEMILALFLIICVCVSDVCSSFGLDFLFGPQTESEFEDYEETAKFLGFRKPEMVMEDDVTSTEPDVEEQTTMNTENPNITRKIITAPMRKFVYFTKPKLKIDELIDNDDDDEEEGDEEDDITFEEIHRTTTVVSDEDSAILQQENRALSWNAEEQQDIKSELTSQGITNKSNALHLTILLTCLLILYHHRTLLYCQPIEIKFL